MPLKKSTVFATALLFLFALPAVPSFARQQSPKRTGTHRRRPARRHKKPAAPAGSDSAAPTDTNSGGDLPNLPTKPTPQFETNSFCPPEGDATSPTSPGDSALNRLKNRVDESDTYYPVDFVKVQTLPYPNGIGKKKRKAWTKAQTDAVSLHEGTPVALEGYLALVTNQNQKVQGARPEGSESCNCHSTQADQIDFHIWLLPTASASRTKAVVVEATPRVRAHHPGWTVARLTSIAKNKQRVRISGWLTLDEEHPEQIGKTRATLWEIHPIMKIEYQDGGQWKALP